MSSILELIAQTRSDFTHVFGAEPKTMNITVDDFGDDHTTSGYTR